MTASTVTNNNSNGRQAKNRSKGQSSPSKPKKKASEELITPEALLLMTAASTVVSTKKGNNGKSKSNNNNNHNSNNNNVDIIPTKENNGTPDILALLGRQDNAVKMQASPVKNASNSSQGQRPLSPPTKDQNANRSRKNSPVSLVSASAPSGPRYAGSSYSNSPAPSQLPKPMFGNLASEDSHSVEDLTTAVRRIDFSEEEHNYQQPLPAPVHHHFHPQVQGYYPPQPHMNHQFLPYQPHLIPHPPHFFHQPMNSVPQPVPSVIYHQPQVNDMSFHLKSMLNIGAN